MEALARTDAQREALRQYYSEHETLTSIDGIFKIFTVITCVVSSVLHLGGGACGSAQLALGGATVALAAAFLVTALSAASTCSLPTKAPLIWLYTDLVGSTVVGGVLLVTSLLMFSLCEVHTIVDYVHGPVALLGAVLVLVSAVIAYVEVTRRWDEALKAPPAPAAPRELDV